MKKILALMGAVLLLSVSARAVEVSAPSALLMEKETGTVLFAKNEHEKLEPASVTKIMTLLLTMEAIDGGTLRYEDTVTASPHACSMGGSQIWLKEGERLTVDEMLKAVCVVSANDCAVALAEHLAGSEESFVERMNRRAAELGMNDTTFKNACGLPVEGHVTSAYDIAGINPLYAQEKGVLRRAGHTEATIDMCRLSGFYPAGALMEIMNEDGTMARLPELRKMADEFNLKLISIRDMIAYRLQQESIVEKGVEVDMPTEHGHFRLIPFRQKSNGLEHVALFKGTWAPDEPVLVRVHSSCATGDIFGSMRCDCGEQLHKAMEVIEKAGKGVIVYLNQEGRGIGLMEKMRAYKLQEDGMDTVDANICLGHLADERDYGVGAQILRELGVHKMRLLTNNPVKRVGLEAYGLEIVENVPVETTPNQYNERYLRTKKERMGHTLHFSK